MNFIMVGIAQLVSAPDCGSGGPGFESLYPPVFPWEAVPGAFCFIGEVAVLIGPMSMDGAEFIRTLPHRWFWNGL